MIDSEVDIEDQDEDEERFDFVHCIYTLRDEDGNVRYVGCTEQEPEARFAQHKTAKNRIGEWIRSEIKAGRKVLVVVEEWIGWNRDQPCPVYSIERQYIKGYARLCGSLLLNRVSAQLQNDFIRVEADELCIVRKKA